MVGGSNIGPQPPPVAAANTQSNNAAVVTPGVAGGIAVATASPGSGARSSQASASGLNFAGSTYKQDSSSNVILGSQTLVPGGPAITVRNTPISLSASATQVAVGSSTIETASLPLPANTVPVVQANTFVSAFGGSTFSANSLSQFQINSQTLAPGAAVTVSRSLISLAPDASKAIISSSTIALLPAANIVSPASAQTPAVTFAGGTYAAKSNSDFIIDPATHAAGAALSYY